jgi:hypothetical protein
MFEHPAQAWGPAFWISGSAQGVESKTNAKNPAGNPMGDSMAAEIQEHPPQEHGGDGNCCRVCRPRLRERKKSSGYTSDLRRVSGHDRKTTKDFAARRQGWSIHFAMAYPSAIIESEAGFYNAFSLSINLSVILRGELVTAVVKTGNPMFPEDDLTQARTLPSRLIPLGASFFRENH